MHCPQLSELPPPPAGKTGWPWTEETAPLPDVTVDGRQWPRITIVTPSYNQALFLEETIRSVLLQGYPDLEYIIIDGGSTDSSLEIIRRYAPWLGHWVSEPDRGQSHAINKGFKQATGKACAWLNSDDVYLRGALENAIRPFIQEPSTELVYGDLVMVNEETEVQGYLNAPSFSLEELICTNYISQPAAFMRRTALERAGYVNENYHLCMDYDLWLRMASRGRIEHVKTTLAAFRVHSESKTSMQLTRMLVESATIASLFLDGADAPANLQRHRDKHLARPFLAAGLMLWFNGNREDGRLYVQKALSSQALVASESTAISIAAAAIQSCGSQGVMKIHEFLSEFPLLQPVGRSAFGWAAVFLARQSQEGSRFYKHIRRALKCTPTVRMLRAVLPLILSRMLGVKLYQSFWHFKGSLTHSRVGLSLSEL